MAPVKPVPDRIIDAIDRHWQEQWTSPTVRQLARELGYASTSSVAYHLNRMVRDGRLERRDASPQRVLYRRPRVTVAGVDVTDHVKRLARALNEDAA